MEKELVHDHLAGCHGDSTSYPLASVISPTPCRPFCKWNRGNSSSKSTTTQHPALRDSSSSTQTQVLAPGPRGPGRSWGPRLLGLREEGLVV